MVNDMTSYRGLEYNSIIQYCFSSTLFVLFGQLFVVYLVRVSKIMKDYTGCY